MKRSKAYLKALDQIDRERLYSPAEAVTIAKSNQVTKFDPTVEVALRLGTNPASYLRAVRLDRVRKDLLHAGSVTDAATRWGFWHFGHFSNDYREQFGELPSETLRRLRSGAGRA